MKIQIPSKTDSLCALARRMIADGADPDEFIDWYRGETKVFAQTRPLRWWADRAADVQGRRLKLFKHASDEVKVGFSSCASAPRTRPLAV